MAGKEGDCLSKERKSIKKWMMERLLNSPEETAHIGNRETHF
ncbi:hypothetical protein PNH38_09625 [Anoxybacillus rupiensis]|uniref:Uncharacterized protein n=1 Tax=Anoxybacteroides rupiense TaxID=311460 RepID=A0ABT5W4L8_9BACL|nr:MULTISPECIES: hypothetical protein [Anoxybacillus]MDE8564147.1 hypothetical protein [Anoxybacillus rupiensis]